MTGVPLHRLDLNLLVTFQALMETRSVTHAADHLGKTPSAVSHALARLREQLGDPLLVKVGGKMEPSPFALRLIEDVRPILSTIQRVVTPPAPFDPGTSDRTFRMAIPTLPGLMTRVFARASAEAPGVNLEWTSPSQRTYGQVAEGLIDLAMLPSGDPLPDGVSEEQMAPTAVYIFAREGHPAIGNWCLEEWARWPHVLIGMNTVARSTVDLQLAEMGVERRFGARIPDFSGIAPLLSRTNLMAANFGITMLDDLDRYGICVLAPPFEAIAPSWSFLWSSRLAGDPALVWLREMVIGCFREAAERTAERMAAHPPVPVRP